jgi:hypothetical protein
MVLATRQLRLTTWPLLLRQTFAMRTSRWRQAARKTIRNEWRCFGLDDVWRCNIQNAFGMRWHAVLGGGKWQLKPGYYSTPTASFTLDDLRGPISGSPRANMRDSFNSVRGKFNDADQDWITVDYPEISSTVFLAEDNGFEQPLDLELPFTTSSPMAQRLAKITLYRARDAITFSADFGLSALSTQIGDTVSLTIDRYGWSGKTFEVTGWKFYANQDAGDLRVNLVLREISASSFDWDADETEIISNNTNLLKFNQVPNVGVNAVATTRVLNEKVTNFILVTVTASEFEQSQVDYVEVQFRQSDNGDYKTLGTGQLGGFEAVDLDNGFL